MSKSGPIIIVEDDQDDQEMIKRILSGMNVENEIKTYFDGEDALQYLKTTSEDPFIIICDINMPIVNGLRLKEEIEKDPLLKEKSIPFVYLSTSANPQQVKKAYALSTQGFFLKGQSYDALKTSVKQIIEYWKHCIHIGN